MPLSIKQRKFLRELAHPIKPVVIIGQHGLTENVCQEIVQALNYHELIKVRVNADTRESRLALIESILEKTQADPVQQIGHIAVFYKRNHKKPKISVPKI